MADRKDYVKKKYKCPYCYFEFERDVIRLEGKGKHNFSSQIKCQRCGNFLKTW